MEILYLSALSSERLINDIYGKTGDNPGFAVQKFSRLLVKGILKNNEHISTLSSPPITTKCSSNRWVHLKQEEENGVKYKYVPYINIPVLKNIGVFIYTFFYILFWGFRHKKDKTIICDVLSVSLSMGALFASKLNGLTCIGIVTDIWDLMVGAVSKRAILASKINQWYVVKFDKYILLTEQMNRKVNPKQKPYIVMEGLCDVELLENKQKTVVKSVPREVLYAGGIHEKYGLKMLTDAFLQAKIENAVLVYYGSGPYVDEFKKLCESHRNLEYRGVATNSVILEEEHKATLLVNPRFSTEEFTQFSFPSKNMEFMASGTPLLSTMLPGMPQEYLDYIYCFEEETVDGYAFKLCQILSYNDEDLIIRGLSAQKFVLENKNNVKQGKRIIDFICES